MIKTLVFVLFLSFTNTVVVVIGQNPQNNPLLTRPVIRNTKWSSLTDTVVASAENLGYNERSWNDRTATIESLSYETINTAMSDKIPDVNVIGFTTEDSWDCYQNHYEDYTYDELILEGVEVYFNALGWNRDNWEKGTDIPASEDKFYNSLSSAEKDAAFNLCYDQKEWDGISLDPPPNPFPCFSSETLVEKDNGLFIRMDELKIGDRIKSSHNNDYSTVISFSHIDHDIEADFLQMKFTSSASMISTIEISKDHMMYINDGNNIVRANDVKIGDIITEGVIVNSIKSVKRHGVYSPVTNSGNIIASGIHASGYVALLQISPTFQHWAAHAIHAPLRLVCSFNIDFCKDEIYTDGISNYIIGIVKIVTAFSKRSLLVQYMATMVIVPGILALYTIEQILYNLVLFTSVVFVIIFLSRNNKKRKIA